MVANGNRHWRHSPANVCTSLSRLDMENAHVQHKDFNDHVYQRLREKYKSFRLPYSWSNVDLHHRRTNLTHMLRSGLQTPNSQSGNTASRLFSPNWGKQRLIRSLSSRSTSSQLFPGSYSPRHAMLSTQFNGNNQNHASIPLFSKSFDQNIASQLQESQESSAELANAAAVFESDLFGSTPLNDDSLSQSNLNTTAKNPFNLDEDNRGKKGTFSKSLSEALSRTLDVKHSPIQGLLQNEKSKDVKDSSVRILENLQKKESTSSFSFIQQPFKSFVDLSVAEKSAIQAEMLKCDEVAVALSYSDCTSHIGIGSSKQTYEKITVSGICFAFKMSQLSDHIGIFVPVSASGDNDEVTVEFLYAVLTSNILKISFNAYQLYIVCNILIKPLGKNEGVRNIIDLKIASWLLMSDEVPQNLCDLHSRYKSKEDEELNRPVNRDFSNQLYSALVDILHIKQSVYSHLTSEKLLNLFTYLECPLLGTICQMGQTGICINKKELNLLSSYLAKRLSDIEHEASSVLGRPVLLTSPVQLRQILYEELKLDEKIQDKVSRTATNREKSTSEACLLKLKDIHPLPRIILAHRRLTKLKSTYVDGLHHYMKFGKLYPSWDQTSAATGRLAAFNPNVQAFPKDSIEDNVDDEQSRRTVREIIVPSSGCQFVAVDFCSIELRILAHFTKDQELIEMFKGSDDIFTTLTATWKNIPVGNVTSSDRNRTKRVCYAIIYGAGIPKLSQILEVSLAGAKMLISSFLAKFQNISRFTNAVIKRARDTKKLRTILNRLRHFPEINHNNFALRKSIERQAVNFVIQGSAADICKVSMLKLSEYLATNTHINARLLIQIHDELLYEVYHENVDQFSRAIYQTLESPEFTGEIHLSVPLKVKVQTGDSWGSMQEVSFC